MEIHIDGFEETVRRVVREELARAREGWLNGQEAAEYLGISRASLHNLVSSGRLARHGEKGTALRFRPSDLDAYAAARQ
jgi:excisionase family DNA binding protein